MFWSNFTRSNKQFLRQGLKTHLHLIKWMYIFHLYLSQASTFLFLYTNLEIGIVESIWNIPAELQKFFPFK